MAADGAVAACCSSAAAAALRGPSLAAVTMLPAARGALDERRLVGTAASDLNTFAGARGGTVSATLRTRRRENQDLAPRRYDILGNGHLPQGREASLLLPRGLGRRCSRGRRGHRRTPVTSAAHVASLVGCLVADAPAPAPGAVSSAASVALGEGGAGSHLSGRARPPSLSSSSSSDDE
jgi:hypothetical protein